MQLDPKTVSAALCAFLSEEVLAPGVQLTEDAVLADLGVDSFSLMEVILFVEREYGVVLPMESLTPEQTRTVAAISRSVVEAAGGQ